jgi:hypothetical protein
MFLFSKDAGIDETGPFFGGKEDGIDAVSISKQPEAFSFTINAQLNGMGLFAGGGPFDGKRR